MVCRAKPRSRSRNEFRRRARPERGGRKAPAERRHLTAAACRCGILPLVRGQGEAWAMRVRASGEEHAGGSGVWKGRGVTRWRVWFPPACASACHPTALPYHPASVSLGAKRSAAASTWRARQCALPPNPNARFNTLFFALSRGKSRVLPMRSEGAYFGTRPGNAARQGSRFPARQGKKNP